MPLSQSSLGTEFPIRLRVADDLFSGQLTDQLASYRSNRWSWERIAKHLYSTTEGEVNVTGTTIHKWARLLQVGTSP